MKRDPKTEILKPRKGQRAQEEEEKKTTRQKEKDLFLPQHGIPLMLALRWAYAFLTPG
jgi:hypothetical protein